MYKTIKLIMILFASFVLFQNGFANSYYRNLAEIIFVHEQSLMQKIENRYPELSKDALMAGVRAYSYLRATGRDFQQILTIVNFKKPSDEKRLWVINMKSGKVEYNTLVAHGQQSGLVYPKHFSNFNGSHKSSLGVYLTGETYYGIKGYSMRLYGLDAKFNSNAFQRGIVVHGAQYISKRFINQFGHIGRTWGCFGLDNKIAPRIVSKIKEGTVLVAYYPDHKWLSHSPYEKPF